MRIRGYAGAIARGAVGALALVATLGGTAHAAPGDTITTAVQKAQNYVLPDVVHFTYANGCVACHRQGASTFGLSVAKKNGYSVSMDTSNGLAFVANYIANDQKPGGYWEYTYGGYIHAKTSYAYFGLAGYDAYVDTSHSQNLLNAATWAMANQVVDSSGNGYWTEDHGSYPTTYGNVALTARMVVGLAQAKTHADPYTASKIQTTIDHAVTYLRGAIHNTGDGWWGTYYNFEAAYALIGLKAAGIANSDSDVLAVQQRFAISPASGGQAWGATAGAGPDPFNTGIVTYALCQSGMQLKDMPLLSSAVGWLDNSQYNTGAYGANEGYWTSASFSSVDVPTTFAALGLGCYGDYGVNVTVTSPNTSVLNAYQSTPQTATYTFDVENHGFQPDTYSFSVQGGMPGWTASVSPTSLALASTQHGTVTLTVTAPANLPEALSVAMTLVATSSANSAITSSARVTTYTNPPPPTTGDATSTSLVAGANASVTLGTTQRLAAKIVDSATGQTVVGPNKGVVTFFVAGIAVGTDTDADGDGVFSFTWAPDYSWVALGAQDYRAIYSGIDLTAQHETNLLSSLQASTITVVKPADTTPPTVSIGTTPALTNQASLTFTGSASDGQSGLKQVVVLVNGVQQGGALTVASDGSYSATVTLAEGANTILVQATDNANNTAGVTASVTLDSTPPTLAIVSPADGSASGSATISVGWQYSDATATTVTVNGVAGGAAATTAQGATSVSFGSEGYQTVTVVATDAAGNTTTKSETVLIDLTAPVADIDVTDGAQYGPQANDTLLYTLNVSDLGSTSITVSDGTSYNLPRGGGVVQGALALVEGSNSVTFTITNEVGRITTLTRTVVYDKTPPAISNLVPAAGAAVRQTVELSADATDNLTGVAKLTIAVDQGGTPTELTVTHDTTTSTWAATLDTTTLTDGKEHLTVTATDGVGNTATSGVDFIVDNTPPTVAITAPTANGYFSHSITLTATGSDATSGLAGLSLDVNGSFFHAACTVSPCSATFDTSSLPDGAFVLAATATDVAGNTASVQQSDVADNTNPANFLVAPVNGQVVTTSLAIKTNVTDDYFASTQCSLDGVSLGTSSDPQFSTTVDMLSRLDGNHTVACTAVDLAGNQGTQSATVVEHNWTLSLNPKTLNFKSQGGDKSVTLFVEGVNVSILVPVDNRAITLQVPGGSPVALTVYAGSDVVGDSNGNGIPDLTEKFDRQGLIASIKAGIAAGKIDPSKPLAVHVFVGTQDVGSDSINIKQ